MNYYQILGLDPKCSYDEIKKAYKTLALQHHPDKANGSSETFQQINEAYQILRDPEKRKMYDELQHHNFSDVLTTSEIFKMFIAMMMSMIQKKQQVKKHIKISISVDLVDVYKGETKKIAIQTKTYGGETITKYVYIPLTDFQSTYIFEKQGDEYSPGERTDIVIHVKINDHPHIKRDTVLYEHDLYMEQEISLYEYYNSVQRTITHLDGETLEVSCFKKAITACEYSITHVISGKGLPYTDDDTLEKKRGNLYIYFQLHLPREVKDPTLSLLKDHFNEI
jgi:DnaJ-class molecular chaperone